MADSSSLMSEKKSLEQQLVLHEQALDADKACETYIDEFKNKDTKEPFQDPYSNNWISTNGPAVCCVIL